MYISSCLIYYFKVVFVMKHYIKIMQQTRKGTVLILTDVRSSESSHLFKVSLLQEASCNKLRTVVDETHCVFHKSTLINPAMKTGKKSCKFLTAYLPKASLDRHR
jgi:hypothetical protein